MGGNKFRHAGQTKEGERGTGTGARIRGTYVEEDELDAVVLEVAPGEVEVVLERAGVCCVHLRRVFLGRRTLIHLRTRGELYAYARADVVPVLGMSGLTSLRSVIMWWASHCLWAPARGAADASSTEHMHGSAKRSIEPLTF